MLLQMENREIAIERAHMRVENAQPVGPLHQLHRGGAAGIDLQQIGHRVAGLTSPQHEVHAVDPAQAKGTSELLDHLPHRTHDQRHLRRGQAL